MAASAPPGSNEAGGRGAAGGQHQQTKLVSDQPYDESLDVTDTEEVETPTPRQTTAREPSAERRSKMSEASDDDDAQSHEEDSDEESEESESEEDRMHGAPPEGAYDPADYEHLAVSAEVKELFQYITRYTPQTIELDMKLKPFIPDFIPAVGDIDAFLKVPPPDGKPDTLGLTGLDEPCARQSDPTVLTLWLTENSKQHATPHVKVRSVEEAERNPRTLEAWVESISELHRAKPPPNVHYTKPMPDIESLMQEWPPEFEELLSKVSLPSADVSCDLPQYVDLVCAILDVPVYKSRVQALHVLFTLYSEFKNSQHFKWLAEKGGVGEAGSAPQASEPEAETLTVD
ncbi:intraflagellar transport protein 46 homolog isoform X2 [Lampetra fluviatilis]